MALVVTNNSPSAGHIAWTGLVVKNRGIEYNIADDSSDKIFLWWDTDSPTVLQESDTLPTLDDITGDKIVFLNKSGTAYLIPQTPIIRNELIPDYSITEVKLASLTGWLSAQETWTYASADNPTFTFTITGDKTDKYSAGMRVKLTQSATVKYFIITKVAYSSPNTTLTVYGGSNYDLADEAISANYYSSMKAPFGFPLSPDKWTEELSDTTLRTQTTPTQNVWYNAGTLTLTIPIGEWYVEWQANIQVHDTSTGQVSIQGTLSSSNNSESDREFTVYSLHHVDSGTHTTPAGKRKVMTVAAKSIYYLNIRTLTAGVNDISFANNYGAALIRGVSAYL